MVELVIDEETLFPGITHFCILIADHPVCIVIIVFAILCSWKFLVNDTASVIIAVFVACLGNLLIQNVFTMLIPILAGIAVRTYFHNVAKKIERVLTKCAFPALMFLAAVFFIQHRATIEENFTTLGLVTTALILLAVIVAYVACMVFRLKENVRRTIVIEVGMQNAAQAIAIASSPFVFNDGRIAIPAIIYALMMNVVLLSYVGVIQLRLEK